MASFTDDNAVMAVIEGANNLVISAMRIVELDKKEMKKERKLIIGIVLKDKQNVELDDSVTPKMEIDEKR